MKLLKTLLLTLSLTTASLFAGFTNVDCDNQSHLDTLHITQGDCKALEAFWDATNHGEGWIHKEHWDDPTVSAEDWYGITLNDDNTSVAYLIVYDNNITISQLPKDIELLKNLEKLGLNDNNISGYVPASYNNFDYLYKLFLRGNNLSGRLPDLNASTNMEKLYFEENNFTGPIPESYTHFPHLKTLIVYKNHLSGPLPDFNNTVFETFWISANNFTFSDIEPHVDHLRGHMIIYARQCAINESNHTVYFEPGGTLSIEPRLALNKSGNDYYIWYKGKGDVVDEGLGCKERIAGLERLDYNGSRIYTKHNATKEDDEGWYSYDVNNSVVTKPDDDDKNLILHSNTPIHAVANYTPKVSNPPSDTTIHTGDTYTYTPNATDQDGDTLSYSVTGKPDGFRFDTATGKLSSDGAITSDSMGSHPITITVTDSKIPVDINYTLTILPTGVTQLQNGYKNGDYSILSNTDNHPYAMWESNTSLLYILPNNTCKDKVPLAAINYTNDPATLYTAIRDCNSSQDDPTLSPNSRYPQGSQATITDPDTITIEAPIGKSSITLGGN